jgi:divalent metal cation (Fe/Co/Zn/Cd) transporter
MSSLLIGEGASEHAVEKIEAAIAAEGSGRIIHLRTLYVGPEELLVAAKISVGRTQSGEEIAATINAAEARVRAAVPEATVIFLEPDLDRAVSTAQSEAGLPPNP